jgi:hypothetical protein
MKKPEIPKTKKCPRCHKTHPIEMFGLRKMHKDDRYKYPQSQCKKCRSKEPLKKRSKKKNAK